MNSGINQSFPNLMCEQVSEPVSDAVVLVIGSADPGAKFVLLSAVPGQVIVVLARGAFNLETHAGDDKKAKSKPGAKEQQAA